MIARNEEDVLAAILAAAITEAGAPLAHERQPSTGGKYVSHRLRVRVGSAHEAFAVRTRLRAVRASRPCFEPRLLSVLARSLLADFLAPATGDRHGVSVVGELAVAARVLPPELAGGERRRPGGRGDSLIGGVAQERDAPDEHVGQRSRACSCRTAWTTSAQR